MKDWDALYEECIHCQKCGLAETRTNVVFGEGDRDAEVMFIGEGPGEQEDRTGRPFVGRAGKLLDDMLAMIDLKREKVFIGNMVKCRPPQNRDPLNIEQEACIGYLRNQVALLKPKIIVCLGRIAAMKLIKEDFKITREHGQWIEKAGVWMMAMYHPSALLRDPRKRPESFEDLKSDIDGFEVCRRIRAMDNKIGIIMLTARTQEMDKVTGLMTGADDYVTKPFSPAELTARVDALFRRTGGDEELEADDEVVQPPFRLNTRNRTLEKNGQRVKLTQVEYGIVKLFMENPGKALSREEILDAVWGRDYFGELKIVDVNIRRLRIKIEDDATNPVYITTVWGYGYKWSG